MSTQAMAWALRVDFLAKDLSDKQTTATTLKAVLLALADHADPEGGNIFANRERIALFASCSVRTFTRALSVLEGFGLIEREVRPGRTTVFRLAMDATDPGHACPDHPDHPGRSWPDHPGHGWPGTRDTHGPITQENPGVNPTPLTPQGANGLRPRMNSRAAGTNPRAQSPQARAEAAWFAKHREASSE